MRMLKVLLLVTGIVASAGEITRAEVVLTSNFSNIGSLGVTTSQYVGFGFTTGTSTSTLDFASTTASLFSDSAPVTPTIQLFTNSAGSPGTLLTTLSGPDITSASPTQYTYTGAQSLSPSTSYWLVFSSSSASYNVNFSGSSPSDPGSSGYVTLAGALSTNSGSSWNPNFVAGLSSVSISAVPEPSTLAMGIASLTGLAVAGWGRMRRAGVAG